jgi:Tol biopolymer transport system component
MRVPHVVPGGWRSLLFLALVGVLVPSPAFGDTMSVVRASVDTMGGDPDSFSFNPSIDGKGRRVAFWSTANDLVSGDDNFADDVFVRDLRTQVTIRASLDVGSDDPNGKSFFPTISASGRYVAFASDASDLVPGDGNGLEDIFVRDLKLATTTRVTVDSTGGDANGGTRHASISADGGHVIFVSTASDLVPGDGNGLPDVFVRDLQAGTTTRASVDVAGGDANGQSGSFFLFDPPSMSASGRYAAFFSDASDLVPNDGNGVSDVFVRDLARNQTIRVSVDVSGGDPDGGACSNNPSISANGGLVAFCSYATDLVPDDDNGVADVFVYSLNQGTIERVSVDTVSGDADGGSFSPSLNGSGRQVAFASTAADLVPGDGNGLLDVFVRDMSRGVTRRVSVDVSGGDANGVSGEPSISRDGASVAFHSSADDLVPGDGNQTFDIFVGDSRR